MAFWALVSAASAMPTFAADIHTTVGGKLRDVSPFGSQSSAAYGQTFTAGGTTLTSFSLFLNGRFAGVGPLDFKGYVGSWDGGKLGTVLYTSTVVTTDNYRLTEFAFNTDNLSVTEGSTYVAFLSISELAEQPLSSFYMPLSNSGIAGSFVFLNNNTNFGALFIDRWADTFSPSDAYFKASFGSAVPEPATWALMISGFGLVGSVMRRRAKLSTLATG